MSQPLISVLLPFHNPGDYFREAIESVLCQEAPQFELILVNNDSDSESISLAVQYTATYPNVVLVHQPQPGIAHALNAGLSHCKGTFIARMDSDDRCLPGRLKLQAEFLENHPDYGLVSGQVRLSGSMVNNEGMQEHIRQINRLISYSDLYHFRFIDAPFAHPSVMFRKSLIEKFGAYRIEEIPEDFELWLRWFSNGIRMGKLPVDVIEWRDHANRLSRVHKNYTPEAFDRVRLDYLTRWIQAELSPALPVYIWGGGKLSRKKMRLLQAEGVNIAGFIDVNRERKIKDFHVYHYSEIPVPGTIFIISLVSNRGKHAEIRQYLLARGYLPDKDFIMAG